MAAEYSQLCYLSRRRGRRCKDVCGDSCIRGKACQAGTCIARRCGCDNALAQFGCLGDGDGGGSVFQRSCWISPVVFEPHMVQSELRTDTSACIQRRPADLECQCWRTFLEG